MNILLVWPRTPDTFWNFRHVLPFIARRAAHIPLGLLTVAGMLPRNWHLKLVDLNVDQLGDDIIDWADCVFLSAMLIQAESARQIIARCHGRGRTLVAGGPLFTTGRDRFPEVRHVVSGEAEDVIPQLIADLESGTLQPLYESAARPDVANTPPPRWDLLNLRHYATMSVQFSRGCPFNCEFCDVIVLNGRTPRIKSPAQLIAELDALLDAGWNGPIFFVDDNFIGNRARVKPLLREIIDWRRRRRVPSTFTTQASLNLADDPELMRLMVEAGFKRVFIGIESPQVESLVECAKVQNAKRDLVASVRRIHSHGLEVMGGFIVGFDSDTPGIFEQQLRFIREAGVVTAMVGLLTALPGTQLFQRLTREGRLLGHSSGNNLDAMMNFVPRLDRQMLIDGYRRLVNRLYAPREYYARILAFLRDYRPSGPPAKPRLEEFRAFIKSLWIMGVATRGRREFWKFLTRTALFHRDAFNEALTLAITGHHFRKIAASL